MREATVFINIQNTGSRINFVLAIRWFLKLNNLIKFIGPF